PEESSGAKKGCVNVLASGGARDVLRVGSRGGAVQEPRSMKTRSLRCASPLPAALARFHLPPIEPDVRVCRIRLSDKAHALAPVGLEGRPVSSCSTPKRWCRYSSGNRVYPVPCTLNFRFSHCRSLSRVYRITLR